MTYRILVWLLLVTQILSACTTALAEEKPEIKMVPGFPDTHPLQYRGAGVMMYGNWGDIEHNASQVLDRIKVNGGNSVSLVFPFYQDDPWSTSVYPNFELTPTDAQLETWFRLAHQRGMKVLLRPIMDEASLTPHGYWRGSIEPSDVDAWFESYTSFILHYAQLAEKHNVAIFSVGAELNSLESETDNWLKIIDAVRGIYRGQIVYSANWGINDRVQFWDQLDFIGLDAFFNLDAEDRATVEELIAEWQPWVEWIKSQNTQYEKPILFTEIGVQSTFGSYREPWRWVPNAAPDQKDQATYYQASCIAALQIPVQGIYWWAIGRELPDYDPALDTTHNFIYKEVEKEVADCFD